MKRKLLLYTLAGNALIAMDQVSKLLWTHYGGELFHNYQFAFSLPVPRPVMYAIYTLIEVAIIAYLVKTYAELSRPERFAWVLIVAGSLSNIGERVILGYVRDFIPMFNGILNFADFYILLGAALLLGSNLNLRKSSS